MSSVPHVWASSSSVVTTFSAFVEAFASVDAWGVAVTISVPMLTWLCASWVVEDGVALEVWAALAKTSFEVGMDVLHPFTSRYTS